jgi:hypothetical protein
MRSLVWTVALTTVVLWSSLAGAQSQLATADAGKFMGTWALELSGPQGSLPLNLVIKDQGGKVAGELKADLLAPADPALKDFTKSGDDLVVKYMGEAQGMSIPVALTLTLDGADKLKVKCDIADGQFTIDGTGTKK